MRAILTTAIVSMLALGTGSGAEEKDSAKFIIKPGEYKLHGDKLELRVKEDGKSLRFEVDFTGSGGGTLSTSIGTDKSAGWCAYAASTTEVWVYQGKDALWLAEYLPGKKRTSAQSVDAAGAKDLLKRAPRVFLDRLPDEFKKQAEGQ